MGQRLAKREKIEVKVTKQQLRALIKEEALKEFYSFQGRLDSRHKAMIAKDVKELTKMLDNTPAAEIEKAIIKLIELWYQEGWAIGYDKAQDDIERMQAR